MNENLETNPKDKSIEEKFIVSYLNRTKNPFVMLSIEQVAKDLHIGINQAYELFGQADFPSVAIGKRKKVSLASYLFWKLNKKM